jgi:aryl-alcohol dehydrogenase-like predicted oxidoreductase/RimJ/RimL family protein N-acetyltransferase
VIVVPTRRFVLRELTAADVTTRYLNWLRDDAASRHIVTARATQTLDDLRSYVSQREGRADVLFLGIFTRDGGRHIGNIKYEPVDPTAQTATMGMLIGEPDWRGRGVAGEVLEATMAWLHAHRGIQTFELGVDRDNRGAIKAYERAGFRISRHLADAHGETGYWMTLRYRPARHIALGTAQFGMHYGIANRHGQPGINDIREILAVARDGGIRTIDTAMLYGDSELRLGEAGVRDFDIVTKLGPVPLDVTNVSEWVKGEVDRSRKRLGVDRLHGLLLHRPGQLLEERGNQLADALQTLRADGITRSIGVSVYDPSELESLQQLGVVDLVQAPFNAVDRRMIPHLVKLKAGGTEVHTRSAFLQGLLLLRGPARPAAFSRWNSLWSLYESWLDQMRLTPLEANLGYVLSIPDIDRVVIGVESPSQLKEIVNAAMGSPVSPPPGLQSHDAELINPSLWSRP